MHQRIALAIASTAATATLTVALAAAGFGPATPDTTPADPVAGSPGVQVDTIYVAPPPPQEVITIRQTASGGSPEGEEHEGGEHEGGEDDD